MKFYSISATKYIQWISGYKDSLGWGVNLLKIAREAGRNFFTPPPLEKYIMMYIKLLVLVGFDLNFPLIFGINKLYQIKTSFPTFQLSHCFTSFIIVIKFTLGFPIANPLRAIARNACIRLCHFIARNCTIIANREAIWFSRNCAQRNCFASKNMCSEEMNQTNGSARYTKFYDWSIILSNNTVTGARAFYLSIFTKMLLLI